MTTVVTSPRLDAFLRNRLKLFRGEAPDADWVEDVASLHQTTAEVVWAVVRETLPHAPVTPRPHLWVRPDVPGAPVEPPRPTFCAPVESPYDRVLNALRARGARLRPKRDSLGREAVYAPCPAHADTRPSLAVTRDDPRALVYCFAGCKPEAVLTALGLHVRDLGPRRPPTARRVVATYDYQTLDGTVVGRKVRCDPKAFRWQSYADTVSVYRLPDLIDTPTVFLTEGEKAVDRLWMLGVAATCGPHGAGRWAERWSRDLWVAGCRELVVLSDHDASGRAHAERVAAVTTALREAITVRVVHLPGLGVKADVVDWLAAGHSADELLAVAAETPGWSPTWAAARRLTRRRECTRDRVRRHREKLRGDRGA